MTADEEAARERKREQRRRYREKNPEKVKAARRRHREKYPEKWKESRRQQSIRYRARYPEKTRASRRVTGKRWYWRDPESARRKKAVTQRRAKLRKRAALGRLIQAAAAAAVPASLPRHVRDDVIAALVLGVIEKRYKIADMPALAKREITAHNRMFDQFKTVSIDAPIGGEGLTIADRLADDIGSPTP